MWIENGTFKQQHLASCRLNVPFLDSMSLLQMTLQHFVVLALAVFPLRGLAQPLPSNAPVAGPPRVNFTAAPIAPPMTAPVPNLFTFSPVMSPPTNAPVGTPATWSPVTNAPIVSPPSNAPIRAPTNAPILAPTNAPIVAPTNLPIVTPTNLPIVAPTNVPIRAPTMAPIVAVTTAPVLLPTTALPTRMPALAPVTEVPTISPSLAPTTLAPTTAAPVDPFVFVKRDEIVQHLTITYPGVKKLDFDAEEVYSEEISPWFDAYFVENRRRLQESVGIRNMVSHVDFADQEVTDTANTITYTQSLSYEANGNAPPPQEIVKLPFDDASYRDKLTPILQNRVSGFDTWTGALATPKIVPPPGPDNPVKDETFFSPAIISGIAGGGIALCGLLGFLLFCCMKNRKKHKDYGKAEEQPPDQFQFSRDSEDGISIMDEPLAKRAGASTDGTSLGYGDQRYVGTESSILFVVVVSDLNRSVATVDYDYSKAYGGGAGSVVSSVGGTLGDTTRLTAENVGSTRAALGANVQDVRQQGGVHEEVIVIEAPPGYVKRLSA